MAKTKPSQSLLSLMRRLRKVLPKDIRKTSPTRYVVANRVQIELNYYCRWGANQEEKEKAQRECHPHSITVSTYWDYDNLKKQLGGSYPSSKASIFRTRTFLKGKVDGDFNLESIATAVTKGIESWDKWVADVKDRERKTKVYNQIVQGQIRYLLEMFPGTHPGYRGVNWRNDDDARFEISILGPADPDQPEVNYNVDLKLEPGHLVLLLPIFDYLKGINDAQASESREGNRSDEEGGSES